MKPKIGIIIVTYNSEATIKNCLNSILKNTYTHFNVLVIDNNSSDNTVNIINKDYPKVILIKNKINIGFGAANNIGIKFYLKSNYDYVLLLNPDTFSSSELITKLQSSFNKNKNIGIAGCIITYANNEDKIWFGGGYFNKTFCYTKHKYMNQQLTKTHIVSCYTDFITGACMMIDIKVFSKTGYLPELYMLYFEDVFFCRKVIEKKYNVYLLNEPLISHRVSTSTGIPQTNIMTPIRAYYFARNPIFYLKNNLKGYRLFTGFFGQFFIRCPYYIIRCMKEKNLKSLSWYFKGIYDGFFKESSRDFLNNF